MCWIIPPAHAVYIEFYYAASTSSSTWLLPSINLAAFPPALPREQHSADSLFLTRYSPIRQDMTQSFQAPFQSLPHGKEKRLSFPQPAPRSYSYDYRSHQNQLCLCEQINALITYPAPLVFVGYLSTQ